MLIKQEKILIKNSLSITQSSSIKISFHGVLGFWGFGVLVDSLRSFFGIFRSLRWWCCLLLVSRGWCLDFWRWCSGLAHSFPDLLCWAMLSGQAPVWAYPPTTFHISLVSIWHQTSTGHFVEGWSWASQICPKNNDFKHYPCQRAATSIVLCVLRGYWFFHPYPLARFSTSRAETY